MQNIPVPPTTIAGWQPGQHIGLSSEVRVLDGKNYRWINNGPCSGWGNDFVGEVVPRLIDSPFIQFIHTFLVGDRAVVITPYGAYGQVGGSNQWEELASWSPTDEAFANAGSAAHRELYDYPWSQAFIGDTYYFCHPVVGLVTYEYPYNRWTCHGEDLTGENDCGLEGPYFSIAEASNRLILLTLDTISWSRPDNGLDLSCSTICGGNFVSLSVATYGKPLGIASFGDDAIVWTTRGTVRLVATAANAAQAEVISSIGFRTIRVPRSATPINPYAFVHGPDGSVFFLSKSGLAVINAETQQAVDPVFSYYLIEHEILRLAKLHNQHSIRLFHSPETDELFISTVHHNPRWQRANVYARSYVYSTRYQKWSSFDQEHYVIGPVNYSADAYLNFMLGFIGTDLRPHWFNFAFHNSYGGGMIPIQSEVLIGPITIQAGEELFRAESSIRRLRVYHDDTGPLFNFSEVDYNSRIQPYAEFNATVSTLSDHDGSSYVRLGPADLKPTPATPITHDRQELSTNRMSQDYGCKGTGLYHIISISTTNDQVDQFFNISGISVELMSTNILK